MVIVRSRMGVPIRLTDERWRHITTRHPEMESQRERVLETLSDPDMIQEGDVGEHLAVRHYELTPLTQKFLVVAYREIARTDGFILTAYLARRPATWRVTTWNR